MRKQIPLDNPDQFPDLLSCFQGRTNGRQRAEREIGERLGVDKSTVSRTINRALSRLRELADVYFDE